ncbi:dipeptidase [Paenibacillus thermoaerophilus]|uniref:Dipeptidase n=1 Tax=Paenibacillus thermoaerophilus TaxID=1215385 RepID=A0ABW2V0Z1_9BACL|nr:dipeptidase [Paenibacillus thermoaerophilus]
MRVVDAHCDAIYKLMKRSDCSFMRREHDLDVCEPTLREGRVSVQCFAVFLGGSPEAGSFDRALEAIDIYERRIVSPAGFVPIRRRADLERVIREGLRGSILTLEGADCLQAVPERLRTAFRLGVRMLGLTWNHANWAADGVMEPRGGGLTTAGRTTVEECMGLGMLVDVSHLSDAAFADAAELAARHGKPLLASHSNARSVCGHPRNATDDQIATLIGLGGMIGLTFVPWFLRNGGGAGIEDVLPHLDRVIELGGEQHVGFGSDFDGIDSHAAGLEHPGHFRQLERLLVRRYGIEKARWFLHENWERFWLRHLPADA